MLINTFSIVAHDPQEQAWGVAVASKFLAVGSLVSWAQAGAGAIATQAYTRVSYGPDGLALLAEGRGADETLAALLASDPEPQIRQVGIVDANGHTAAHTGSQCTDWAGHVLGDGFCVQGNLLAGPQVIEAMADAYRQTQGELAERLMAALAAGQAAGGDRRGRQSAALLVERRGGGYRGDTDRYIDLRVDDDPYPIEQLSRLLRAHRIMYRGQQPSAGSLAINPEIARELQGMMQQAGYLHGTVNGQWDNACQADFARFIDDENLGSYWPGTHGPDHIDQAALDYLRERDRG